MGATVSGGGAKQPQEEQQQQQPQLLHERQLQSQQQLCAVSVPFNSQCEHHMLPFYGTASVVFMRGQHSLESNASSVTTMSGGDAGGGGGDGDGEGGSSGGLSVSHGTGSCVQGVCVDAQTHAGDESHVGIGGVAGRGCERGEYGARRLQSQPSLSPSTHSELQGQPSLSPSTHSEGMAGSGAEGNLCVSVSEGLLGEGGGRSRPRTSRCASAREQQVVESIVGMYTQRLQVQERITHQVADAVAAELEAEAVVVMVDAAHMCMVARGVENHAGRTSTVACRGLAISDSVLCHQAMLACRQRSRPPPRQ